MTDNYALELSLAALGGALTERETADSILACNEESVKYGLTLSESQARALAETRTRALNESRRVELNGSAVDKLILAFCDSPYIGADTYEDVLHELICLFYDLKNSTWDRVSDDEAIGFMKEAFNGRCRGSMELLADEALRLSGHIHRGRGLAAFGEEQDGSS